MEKSKFPEDLLEPLSQPLRTIILHALSWFVGSDSSDYTDHSNQEEKQSHEKCSEGKVEVADVHCLQDMNSASEYIDNREGKEVVDQLPGPEVSVVCQNVGNMTSSEATTDGSVEAEYEEEFLVSSSNTVTKEETMMV